MTSVIAGYEAIIGAIPLALLEVWGRFAYVVGLFLAVCAFGGFTFRIGERWGFGRTQQTWNAKAFLSIPLTFVLIVASGYVGSFIVLVAGAQTFESLKDLAVLLCIVLLGYPALIAVPPAYMLSDLIEGVPPDFVLNWAEGYFFWAAFVWMAYQLIGRNPDFRSAATWLRYGTFVGLIMLFDPVMWGFICSGKFTSAISYRNISSALAFTLSITWVIGPVALLVALPLARRFGWFWAEIPGHVRERAIGASAWAWEAGRSETAPDTRSAPQGLPIRVFIFTPFILLLLVMVGATSIVALRSADDDAALLATRLHQAASINIRILLDGHLAGSPSLAEDQSRQALAALLRRPALGPDGRAFILDEAGKMVASTVADDDAVVATAVAALRQHAGAPGPATAEFKFDHITAKPLSRQTWQAYATSYGNRNVDRPWTLVTAMPESFYLGGFRRASSRSAMVFALALVLSLVLAAALASIVTAPLRRMAQAARTMASGDLSVQVPGSKLEELNAVTQSFNDMATRLKLSFDDLIGEIETRKRRERELAESEARLRISEERWRSVFESSTLGIMLIEHDQRVSDTNSALQSMLGYSAQELKQLSPMDIMAEEERGGARRRLADLSEGKQAAYEVVTRYRRKDGALIWVNSFVSTIHGDENSKPIYFATAIDITDRYKAESELRRFATYLAEAEKLSHTGCWAWNLKTGEAFWSQEQWRILGLDPETTRPSRQMFLDLIHPEDRAAFEEAEKQQQAYSISFRVVLRDGTVKYLHSVGKPQFEESGEVSEYIGVTMDETGRVRANAAAQEAQGELARVARLTTMGELTASIAHEINQPLAAVVANGNAALRWLAHTPPNMEETKDALKAVIAEGNRASDVIGRIRVLLQHRKPEYVGLDINEAIREVLGLTVNTLRGRDVAVQTQLPAKLPPALGDRVQLQQVIMNLIMNGADAMSSVTDRPRVLHIESQADKSGGGVVISIRDSGIGIDEAIRERIFTPLFTTKPTGMGMGLPICRSIVEAHGGKLWASRAEPYGTDFRFTIPSANNTAHSS